MFVSGTREAASRPVITASSSSTGTETLLVRKRELIGIGGHLAMPPLPHHRAYGSVPRRFDWVKLLMGHHRFRPGSAESGQTAAQERDPLRHIAIFDLDPAAIDRPHRVPVGE